MDRLKQIEARVEKVRLYVEDHDDWEMAHAARDCLFGDVLQWIRDGEVDPVKAASLALETDKIFCA